jgi:hypothetical protein
LQSTFSPKGGCKERADPKTNLYTNAIATMVSGDGLNHTPCLLFTRDLKMAKEQKKLVVANVFEANLKKH